MEQAALQSVANPRSMENLMTTMPFGTGTSFYCIIVTRLSDLMPDGGSTVVSSRRCHFVWDKRRAMILTGPVSLPWTTGTIPGRLDSVT